MQNIEFFFSIWSTWNIFPVKMALGWIWVWDPWSNTSKPPLKRIILGECKSNYNNQMIQLFCVLLRYKWASNFWLHYNGIFVWVKLIFKFSMSLTRLTFRFLPILILCDLNNYKISGKEWELGSWSCNLHKFNLLRNLSL